jgi:hypothetical protein
LFAHSPVGNDGYYPHESVREVIEGNLDERLILSYVVTEKNKRGVYTPDAGITEMKMASRYKKNADQIRILYDKTAKIFDRLYQEYLNDSVFERRCAEDDL